MPNGIFIAELLAGHLKGNDFFIKFQQRKKPILKLVVILLLAFLLVGCETYLNDGLEFFPKCVGSKEDFDPTNYNDEYHITLRGADTIQLLMIFTNYTKVGFHIISRPPIFQMWIGNGTDYFYKGSCDQNQQTDEWFGNSGLKYQDQYATLDFEFDVFDCLKVSGTCTITVQDSNNKLPYSFEGKK